MQNYLMKKDKFSYEPTWMEIIPAQVMEELKLFFTNHVAALNKKLSFPESVPLFTFKSDLSLLMRVLCNMVTNALEATDENGIVKVWTEQTGKTLSFCVWNDKEIKDEIKLRIFQRNFSTKEEAGRGIGTYSMKLFGETILGGKVSFITSGYKGTTFMFSLVSKE